MATQDPTTVEASLTQADATLAGAEANLSLAKAGTSASSLAQAEAQVNSAYVSYQNALTNLADTKAVNAEQTEPGIHRIHGCAGAGDDRWVHAE